MDSDCVRSNGLLNDDALLATVDTKLAPALFARKQAHDTVRVWVPGCATGEVAYLIASVLHAHAQQRDDSPAIQLFATDNDERAIAIARHGQYREQLASALTPKWLQFFSYAGQQYQISKTVRNLVTFAQHQILYDPPFARIDLIVCGNLFVSLAPDAQALVLSILHWSLRPSGYLVMNAGDDYRYMSELFAPLVGVSGVFQRLNKPTGVANLHYQRAPADQRSEDERLHVVDMHLQTMNQALRRKVSELTRANNDLNNLLSATDLAIIFLDRALQVTRFTPQAQAVFNIIPADRGRPLAHITHVLDYDQLMDDATNVLASLQGIECEVAGTNGGWYLVRLRPYRTVDEQIDGVVLTCMDITERRLARAHLQRARDELEQRVLERTRELKTTNTRLQGEIAERTRLEQERTELLRQLVLTQEDERRRIARELHDQLGQSVSALGMGLALLSSPAADTTQHGQIMARLQRITEQLDQDMRRLATELRPALLDDLGLVEALQHDVENWTEQSGIQAEFQTIVLEAGRLPRELETVIYRVIQESLTNVYRHAQASDVSVILEQHHDHVRVIVEDDGRGFDLDALQQAPDVQQRVGLLGMRERVALMGGTVAIETAPGAGTTLFVQMPIPVQAPEEHPSI